MVIDLRHDRQITACDAHIFCVDGFVFKLFTRNWRSEEAIRRMCNTQCTAYEIAHADSYLKNHVAAFFGKVAIEEVISAAGETCREKYILDCCYKLELLSGVDQKLTIPGLRDNNPHLQEAQRRFGELSIDVLDASVFCPDDPKHFKFIDFKLNA
jgi:hypothetical protein